MAYETYIIMTKAKYNSALPSKLKDADKLSWNEYTYKDVEKDGTREVYKYDYYPSMDNTKAEIKAYMDDAEVDYKSSDTKAELLEKLINTPHDMPKKTESYKYTESVVDTTTLQSPTWQESVFKLGKLGSPRWNKAESKVLVKYQLGVQNGELSQVDGVTGITCYSHAEVLEEMKKDEWQSQE